MPNCAKIAAALHAHLCEHDWHGYTQGGGRWGDGEGYCQVYVDGKKYKVEQGDRDCSSSIIDCWKEAIRGTSYEGKLDAATYTGNMRKVFVESGLFEWKPMTFIAQRGDIYLNEVHHTAMCQSAKPDLMSEFSINENGGIVGGQVGDQTGRESHIVAYRDFPWDGILHYNGKANSEPEGWQRDDKGWWYRRSDGSHPFNQWKQIDKLWYYFDNEGYAVTGWRQLNGHWYYLHTEADEGKECAMHTGFLWKNGKLYYLRPKAEGKNPEGSMVTGNVEIKCKFDTDGALIV